MANEWHYAQGGKQFGPVASAELRSLASSGVLRPTDLVWKPGMEQWVQAVRLRGLFPAATHPADPPPVPSLGTIGRFTAEANTTKRGRFTLKRIAIAVGVSYGICFVVGSISTLSTVMSAWQEDTGRRDRLLHAISEGDRLWEANDRDSAVATYMPLVNEESIPWSDVKQEVPRVYSRIVDHAASGNDRTLAVSVIEKAVHEDIGLSPSEPAAKELSADVVSRMKAKEDASRDTEEFQDTSQESANGDKPFFKTIDEGNRIPRRKMDIVGQTMILKIKPGMRAAAVESLMGKPTLRQKLDKEAAKTAPLLFPRGRDIETWAWVDADEPNEYFIIFTFVNGVLESGGSGGFDIKTGFKQKLPKNISSADKQRLKQALGRVGIKAEE